MKVNSNILKSILKHTGRQRGEADIWELWSCVCDLVKSPAAAFWTPWEWAIMFWSGHVNTASQKPSWGVVKAWITFWRSQREKWVYKPPLSVRPECKATGRRTDREKCSVHSSHRGDGFCERQTSHEVRPCVCLQLYGHRVGFSHIVLQRSQAHSVRFW